MINIELTQNELIVLASVVKNAADEFSNHGCNEVDVTKLDLTSYNADEIRTSMAQENIIETEAADGSQGSKYLQDDQLLRFLHKKLKKGLSTCPPICPPKGRRSY